MRYNDRGEELPDSTPVEVPLRFKRPPSLQEQLKAMVRRELSAAAADQGFESFEESDDFDGGDDEALPFSQYEVKEMSDDVRIAKPDASKLDKKEVKEDDGGAVNDDRSTKEKQNVHAQRVVDDEQGAGRPGEVGAASGGKG